MTENIAFENINRSRHCPSLSCLFHHHILQIQTRMETQRMLPNCAVQLLPALMAAIAMAAVILDDARWLAAAVATETVTGQHLQEGPTALKLTADAAPAEYTCRRRCHKLLNQLQPQAAANPRRRAGQRGHR